MLTGLVAGLISLMHELATLGKDSVLLRRRRCLGVCDLALAATQSGLFF